MPKLAPTYKNKFQRYRQHQHAKGLKLLRVWVPDPHVPEFIQAAIQQAHLLNGAPEENEALDFIETHSDKEE